MENLNGVSAEVAAAKPALFSTNDGAHSIWEIANHLLAWQNFAAAVLDGEPYVTLKGDADWPPVVDKSAAAWEATVKELAASHGRLCSRIDGLTDGRLRETIPGADYPWRVLLRGVGEHNLYHAGQIGLLKRSAK
jgi:hypothetical protein